MSWTLKQFAENFTYPGGGIDTQTLTFPNACTPGSLIVVLVTGIGALSTTTPTISDGTNSYNQIGSGQVTGGYGSLYSFFALNSSSSALSVAWAVSGALTSTFPAFQIAEFVGNASSDVLDKNASATGASGNATVAISATKAGELAIGIPIYGSGQSGSVSSSWTFVNNTRGMFYQFLSAAGDVSPTSTPTAGGWGIIGATFFAPSSGPSGSGVNRTVYIGTPDSVGHMASRTSSKKTVTIGTNRGTH